MESLNDGTCLFRRFPNRVYAAHSIALKYTYFQRTVGEQLSKLRHVRVVVNPRGKNDLFNNNIENLSGSWTFLVAVVVLSFSVVTFSEQNKIFDILKIR